MTGRSRDEPIAAKANASAPLIDALPRFLARELDMHRRTFIGNEDVLSRIRNAFSSLPPVAVAPAQEPPHPQDRRPEVRAAVVASLAEELMIDAADIRDGSGFLDLGLDPFSP